MKFFLNLSNLVSSIPLNVSPSRPFIALIASSMSFFLKAPQLLRENGFDEDVIHSVCSHGYGITVPCGETIDVEPVHEMEKVLFAADELTGLIWAAALMRPSKSTKDMELKSLKKKYKSKGFAAGCSREVIERGAEQLGWELDKLLLMTLQAMAANEDLINSQMASLG